MCSLLPTSPGALPLRRWFDLHVLDRFEHRHPQIAIPDVAGDVIWNLEFTGQEPQRGEFRIVDPAIGGDDTGTQLVR